MFLKCIRSVLTTFKQGKFFYKRVTAVGAPKLLSSEAHISGITNKKLFSSESGAPWNTFIHSLRTKTKYPIIVSLIALSIGGSSSLGMAHFQCFLGTGCSNYLSTATTPRALFADTFLMDFLEEETTYPYFLWESCWTANLHCLPGQPQQQEQCLLVSVRFVQRP